ncbi:TM1802 family CRISPR-associated protein [Runella zeae]|uniref:TM1802 family CRISPR-associated protein n=1 Tax=Runella zeae TaxID=94255 RepID=UPI000413A564|nr:TM1802 family CRISPR-associated protein [Runella zeae]
MLQTLIKIGQQKSQNLGEWDDVLDWPKIETENKKGEKITNYVLPIIFDLDESKIKLGELGEYDDTKSVQRLFNIKIQGGNNKAIYTCAEFGGLEQIRKTFFGATDSATVSQFTEAIDKGFPQLKDTDLFETLEAIFGLRSVFESQFMTDGKIDVKKILVQPKEEVAAESQKIKLNPSEKIVLVVAQVVWSEKGWTSPTYFKNIDGYIDFLKAKFPRGESNSAVTSEPKLCYATGDFKESVGELNIKARYNINKMFVSTTVNYASGFDGSAFPKNYQVGSEIQKYLEQGSKHLLEKYKTSIAGIDHCIIPQLFSKDESDLESTLATISKKSDLLFQYKKLEEVVADLNYNRSEDFPYWITFLAFESDGNFFKTINVIKDVSRTHFEKMIEIFVNTHLEMTKIEGLNWQNVMSAGEGNPLTFNLYTVYNLIPIRKDKVKKNEALGLFKQLLEKRPIAKSQLFGYFKELVLCHWYERYGSYTNIYGKNPFDFAIRNGVFQYLALFKVIQQLNLFNDMEETELQEVENIPEQAELSENQQKIETFFAKMSYTPSQKAMFYLGRAVSSVAIEQYKKGYESKPVLAKLNYNGMQKSEIVRLKNDLYDKMRQFKLHGYMEPIFKKFTEHFNENQWSMKPDEALFYILSGYSFN